MGDLEDLIADHHHVGRHAVRHRAALAIELDGLLLVDDDGGEVQPVMDAGQLLHRREDLHRHWQRPVTRDHQLVHVVPVFLAVLLDPLGQLVAAMGKHARGLPGEVGASGDVEQVGLGVLLLPHIPRTGQSFAGLTPQLRQPEQVQTVHDGQFGVGDEPVGGAARRRVAEVVQLVERGRQHRTGQ